MDSANLENIIEYFLISCHIMLSCITFSVAIFLVFEWRNPKSIFRSSYFVILNCGYLFDFAFSICWIYGRLVKHNPSNPLMPIILFTQWHAQNILGLWDSILGLNRCTALAYPVAHKRIWCKKATAMFLVLIMIFPFIIDWRSFLNPSCKFYNLMQPVCFNYLRETHRDTAFANLAFALLSIIFMLFGIYKSRKAGQTFNQMTVECRLIIQTMASSITLACLYSFSLLVVFGGIPLGNLTVASYFIYLIQFYPSLFILFYVSPIFRNNFIQFYKLSYFFGGTGMMKRRNTIAIKISPSLSTTI